MYLKCLVVWLLCLTSSIAMQGYAATVDSLVSELRTQHEDDDELLKALIDKANSFGRLDLKLSLQLFDTALTRVAEIDHHNLARIHRGLGVNQYYLGNRLQALVHYFKCLEHARAAESKGLEGDARHLIGTIYSATRQYDKAIIALKQALILRRQFAAPRLQAKTMQSLASAYVGVKDLDSALHYARLSLVTVDTLEGRPYADIGHKIIGQVYHRKERFVQADYHLQESLRLRRASQNDVGIVYTLDALASLRNAEGRYTEAMNYAEEMLALCKAGERDHEISLAHAELSKAWAGQGQWQKAYEASRRYATMRDSLNSQLFSRQLNEMLVMGEFHEQELSIALAKSELARADERNQIQRRQSIGVAVGAGLVVVALLLMLRSYRRRLSAERDLLAAEKEIARRVQASMQERLEIQGLSYMLKGQEEERYRMSREIHDALGSGLAGLRFQVERLGANDSQVKDAIESVDSIVDTVRRISSDVMPAALKKFGLDAALRQLAHRLTRQAGIAVTYHSQCELRLEEQTEIMLYRIVQEATTNALKHAGASRVDILTSSENDRYILSIQDDGQGFDPATITRGSGLLNMETRVRILEGEVVLESHPGDGTSILITIPVKPPSS